MGRTPWQASLKAFFPLLTPVIILGGILGGIFTPTEAAAVAVGYAFLIGFFVLRTLTLKEVPEILSNAGLTSAVVLLLVGAAMAFKTVVSLSHAPEQLAELILSLSENPLILLFLINLLLFIVGMFLDAGPAIIILGPILGPDLYQPRRRPDPFRHHHECQPDRRPRHAANGAWSCSSLPPCRAKRSRPSPRRSCRFWPSKS